jgi:glycine cleavage system H protein
MPEFLETTVDKFVFRVATDCFYTAEGVWARFLPEGVQVGLTDYLQQRGGDVAFAHIKPVGTKLAVGDEIAEVETIKANASIFVPIGGTIVEVNANLDLTPEMINDSPYDRGWLAIIEADNWHRDRANLLDPQAYLTAMRSQAEQELNG